MTTEHCWLRATPHSRPFAAPHQDDRDETESLMKSAIETIELHLDRQR